MSRRPLTFKEAFVESSLAWANRHRPCGGISVNGKPITLCEVHLIAWDLCPFRASRWKR